MTIIFNPGIGNQCWNALTVRAKLENIANADKTKQWIQADLSTPQAGEMGKFFWKVVGKHFQGIREGLYSVDIDCSKNILERLGVVVQDHLELTLLFMRAVENFERITERRINVPLKVFQHYLCIRQPLTPIADKVEITPPAVIIHEKSAPVVIHEHHPVVIERHYRPMVTRQPWFNTVGPCVVPAPTVVRQPIFASGATFGARVVPGTGLHTAPTVTRQPVFTSGATAGARVVPGTGLRTAPTVTRQPISATRASVGSRGTKTFAAPQASVASPKSAATRVVPGFGGTRRR